MPNFVGHTQGERQQPLKAHLEGVAERAGRFSESFGCAALGYQTGLVHDVGKYARAAQKRLTQNGPKVDHSTAGGQLLVGENPNILGKITAYCVLGHHSGLPNGGGESDPAGTPSLCGRLKKKVGEYGEYASEIRLSPLTPPGFQPVEGSMGFSLAFLTRMLFSALTDADFLDTEAFMQEGSPRFEGYAAIEELHARLARYIEPFLAPTNALNAKRTEILQACLRAAEDPPDLRSLTVPTGGGKTISSLAFALAHARKHGKERVIYVIPYTSIIEQNAAVFSRILGEENVLEHHSSVRYENPSDEGPAGGDERKNAKHLATENWDAPVVVTTNVQFFESLFGSRGSACRKLHNIANSVVIFDEAQMLPISNLAPCVRAIAELVQNYACTAVLCTATQSSLEFLLPKGLHCKEMILNPPELYEFFRRNSIKELGALSDAELAEGLREHSAALCVVNSRKQAQALYRLIEGEGSYHLSTRMTPSHRRRVLEEIRGRLREALPCRVVSTSLIEAGVDLDFPAVYRAKAGLDSVIQAAGRCNREGRRGREESFVYVFESSEDYGIPRQIQQNLAAFDLVERQVEDLTSLEAISAYFNQLYHIRGEEGLDQKRILQAFEANWQDVSFPFADVARDFKIIDEESFSLLIPTEQEAKEIRDALRRGERSRSLLRRMGMYSISLRKRELDELRRAGYAEALDEQIFALADIQGVYSEKTGLPLEIEAGEAIFF
ncbi:MAG: CRISPR-associated helicase Cas3' [Christensenellaceae bacterium]|jgi:CRISPR-associated endonuclease/helicase Cas3|nr:CRISPR-associated helicase Cas3' [Christensenellaceae bacterium]